MSINNKYRRLQVMVRIASREEEKFKLSFSLTFLINSFNIHWIFYVLEECMHRCGMILLNFFPWCCTLIIGKTKTVSISIVFQRSVSHSLSCSEFPISTLIALLNLRAFDEFLISKYCHLPFSENRKILILRRFIVWAHVHLQIALIFNK